MKPLSGVRVLVADDDEDMREILALVLRHAGADVEAVPSASAAHAALASTAFDALVSDVRMPGGDGTTIAGRVKARDYGEPIPTIALSGFARMHDVVAAAEAGFDVQLTKPVDNDELVSTIAEVVARDRRDLPRAARRGGSGRRRSA